MISRTREMTNTLPGTIITITGLLENLISNTAFLGCGERLSLARLSPVFSSAAELKRHVLRNSPHTYLCYCRKLHTRSYSEEWSNAETRIQEKPRSVLEHSRLEYSMAILAFESSIEKTD